MKREFNKTVAIKAVSDDERTAAGLVLRANELDRQLDFLDADGVRAMFNPSPKDGVMHAVHPNGHASLTRNEVLATDERIDGHDFRAGDWVIQRKYHDPTRWGLVKSGVLSGFSIGGDVSETIEYESIDALPTNVEVPAVVNPETVPDEYHPPSKITNGSVSEISDVDIAAVPSASHAVVKSIGKNVLDITNGPAEFIEQMGERGTGEAEAEWLYDYMTNTKNHGTKMTDPDTDDPDSEPDDATKFRRLKALLGFSPPTGPDDGHAFDIPEVPGDAVSTEFEKALTVAKEGRTLSDSNRQALMAAHDAVESALSSSGVRFRPNRFTDDPYTDFDVADYAKTIDTEMTDENPDDDPALAEKNAETIGEMQETLGTLAETVDKALDPDGASGTDPDGSGDGEGTEKTLPEQNAAAIEEMSESVESVADKVDQIAQQGGGSQQAGKSTPESEPSDRAKAIEIEREVFTS